MCRGHEEEHSRLREGQRCIPRTRALVGSSVCEQRRDREGGAAGWRGRREQVLEGWGSSGQGSFCTQSTAVTGGLQTGKTHLSFYRTQPGFGVEKRVHPVEQGRKPSSKQEVMVAGVRVLL